MKEKIKAELDDSVSMEPWLDGMITAANKILNALLRLRKRQMTMESSIHKQHMESQYDEKVICFPFCHFHSDHLFILFKIIEY